LREQLIVNLLFSACTRVNRDFVQLNAMSTTGSVSPMSNKNTSTFNVPKMICSRGAMILPLILYHLALSPVIPLSIPENHHRLRELFWQSRLVQLSLAVMFYTPLKELALMFIRKTCSRLLLLSLVVANRVKKNRSTRVRF
jgi:hypothetical protein